VPLTMLQGNFLGAPAVLCRLPSKQLSHPHEVNI
jgi:hypothetical protein